MAAVGVLSGLHILQPKYLGHFTPRAIAASCLRAANFRMNAWSAGWALSLSRIS
jgi:hypothetical protein